MKLIFHHLLYLTQFQQCGRMWKLKIILNEGKLALNLFFFCDCVFNSNDLSSGGVFLLKSSISAGNSLLNQMCLLIKGQSDLWWRGARHHADMWWDGVRPPDSWPAHRVKSEVFPVTCAGRNPGDTTTLTFTPFMLLLYGNSSSLLGKGGLNDKKSISQCLAVYWLI